MSHLEAKLPEGGVGESFCFDARLLGGPRNHIESCGPTDQRCATRCPVRAGLLQIQRCLGCPNKKIALYSTEVLGAEEHLVEGF